jgi:hypothetical protein
MTATTAAALAGNALKRIRSAAVDPVERRRPTWTAHAATPRPPFSSGAKSRETAGAESCDGRGRALEIAGPSDPAFFGSRETGTWMTRRRR